MIHIVLTTRTTTEYTYWSFIQEYQDEIVHHILKKMKRLTCIIQFPADEQLGKKALLKIQFKTHGTEKVIDKTW